MHSVMIVAFESGGSTVVYDAEEEETMSLK